MRWSATIIKTLLAVCLALLPSAVVAELVLGIGRGKLDRPDNCCHWNHQEFGGWDMTESEYTPMWSIGYRYQFNETWGIEARYHDYGKYSQFLGFYPDDKTYDLGVVTQTCAPGCDPTTWAYNIGTARAVTLTGTYEPKLVGKLALFVRAGAAVVQNKWRTYRVHAPEPHQRTFDVIESYYEVSLTGTAGIGFSYGRMRLEYVYVHDLETKPKICCAPQQEVRAVELSFKIY